MPPKLSFRPLSSPLLDLSCVQLGCAPSGGLYNQVITVDDVCSLISNAFASGITTLDTAPLYGTGRSEIDIGRAFTASDTAYGHEVSASSKLRVITKVGRLVKPREECTRDDPAVEWGDGAAYSTDRDTADLICRADYTSAGVLQSYQESLTRLGRASVAVWGLRIHDAESDWKVAQLFGNGAVEALVVLRSEGKILEVSLGMNSPEYILRILRHYPKGTFDSVLLAGSYNLIDNSGIPVLEICEELGIRVAIAGVFGAGLLWGTGNYRYRSADAEVLSRRDKLQALCKEFGVELPYLALHFATRPTVVTDVVIGCANSTELQGNLKLFKEVAPEVLAKLPALYARAVSEGLVSSAAIGMS